MIITISLDLAPPGAATTRGRSGTGTGDGRSTSVDTAPASPVMPAQLVTPPRSVTPVNPVKKAIVAQPIGDVPILRNELAALGHRSRDVALPTARSPHSSTVRLRAATSADVEALRALHARCSPNTRYRRYLMATRDVSAGAVRRLLTDTATTVVVAPGGGLVAMGNVVLGESTAEIALLVEDGWQRRGLGVRLATTLARQAVQAGAECLTATVLGTNTAIRRTLIAAGLAPVIVDCDGGTLELHCDLRRWCSPGRVSTAQLLPASERNIRRPLPGVQPLEDLRHTIVVVGGGDLVGGRDHLGVRVGDGDRPAGP